MQRSVAVIGAGCSGLSAVKACKEEEIDVVCFEKSESIGGLWRFHEDSEDGKPSVMKSTVINTQKDITSFTDFPPPDDAPNYMHHTQMIEYFEEYAKQFDLYRHIQFRHEVISVKKYKDYDRTGQWIIIVKSLVTGIVREETYDGVMVCSGHHSYENVPTLPGQELFRGKILHSHGLKTPDSFKDLNILVVGIGNSAVDAAVEISSVAKQVYLSTRKGSWIVPKCGPYGLPTDAFFNSRITSLSNAVIGYKNTSWLIENFIMNRFFNHELYGLKPKHHFLEAHPTLNDYLPPKILSGRIIVKSNVATFTNDSVKFEGEDFSTSIDAVVLATGYTIKFPFIKESFGNIENNRVNFYKLTFPPYLKHPSLAFIGLCQPSASIVPISDVQSQWFAQVFNGNVKLPPMQAMVAETRKRRRDIEERYVGSLRHTIQVDYVLFMDEITMEYGAKPNLLKLLLTDPNLFFKCLLGPCLPYQYRLQGPHSWPGARETILKFPTRLSRPFSNSMPYKYLTHFDGFKAFLPTAFLILSLLINIYFIVLHLF